MLLLTSVCKLVPAQYKCLLLPYSAKQWWGKLWQIWQIWSNSPKFYPSKFISVIKLWVDSMTNEYQANTKQIGNMHGNYKL